MKATIVNFRVGKHTQTGNHMIITVEGIKDRKKASSIVGKKITWKNSEGNSISGKIASAHGNSGAIRAIFEKGMPGQSLGTEVSIE